MAESKPRRVQEKSFALYIKTESSYKVGDPVICEITIINNDCEDYSLLTRETPLEGLRSDIFTVYKGRSREVIPYDGIMLKRGPPTAEECIHIKARSALQKTVDLSEAYCFIAGKYIIQLNMDAVFHKDRPDCFLDSSQPMASNRATFKVTKSRKPPKLTRGDWVRRE